MAARQAGLAVLGGRHEGWSRGCRQATPPPGPVAPGPGPTSVPVRRPPLRAAPFLPLRWWPRVGGRGAPVHGLRIDLRERGAGGGRSVLCSSRSNSTVGAKACGVRGRIAPGRGRIAPERGRIAPDWEQGEHHSTDPRTAENALTAPARGAAARAWLRAPTARRPRTVEIVGVGGRAPTRAENFLRGGGGCSEILSSVTDSPLLFAGKTRSKI